MNGNSTSSDWDGRYYHVDQILDRPGPRTDPSFSAGDEVCHYAACYLKRVLTWMYPGERLPEKPVQDLGHRCWRSGVRDPRELGFVRVQGYPCH